MLVKTRTQKHWFRSEAVILKSSLLIYGQKLIVCQVWAWKKFKYPSTFLRTFFEQKRTIEPESFQTVYKWLEKQFSLIPTGRGQVETQNRKSFQSVYNELKNCSHLFPLRKGKCTPKLQRVFKTFTTRRKKKCKTKKPLHRQQKQAWRERLTALIFCWVTM